ncbi:hypothetical protein [Ornithinibacillus bavariensis]|uniref:hypothetical protein n=1 Tax=Ornithinibacillus bavariensis TaxID=545502 RepID=UPI000ED5BFB0|nr:hypothetical protein [Ornithinibacillus sp.]
MVEVHYKRGFIHMMDLYGSTNIEHKREVDIIIAQEVLFPNRESVKHVSPKGFLHSFGKTLVINLNRTENEIFSDIHKNARYKINRAEKRDSINYHELTAPTDEQIWEFKQFFDQFAAQKKLPKANYGRLKSLRDKEALIISYATDEDATVLCYHAYVKVTGYCSLLYSASARFHNGEIRNKIGRANRYLHWQDMRSFKRMGLIWFDFGGLFVHASTDGENHINRFKKEFGGEEVDVDKRIYPQSMIGRLVVFVFWLKMRKRSEFLRARRLENNRTYVTKKT